MDREAVNFVKSYDNVKQTADKQARVGAVSSLLRSIHNDPPKFQPDTKNLFGHFEFLALPMSIEEENETTSDENNNIIMKDTKTCQEDEPVNKVTKDEAEKSIEVYWS